MKQFVWFDQRAFVPLRDRGADVFSFGEKIKLEDGDVMEIGLAGFGRALRNPIKIDRVKQELVEIKAI